MRAIATITVSCSNVLFLLLNGLQVFSLQSILIMSLTVIRERNNRLARSHLGLFWGLGLLLGYIAISGAKYKVMFLRGDPDIL